MPSANNNNNTVIVLIATVVAAVALSIMMMGPPSTNSNTTTISYVLLAVSGTLEEGFSLRSNLDFKKSSEDGSSNEGRVNATFLGHALVRGYKSFLDIKQPDWREYVDNNNNNYENKPMLLKTVNPAVIPTGCDEHANRYAIYAVDSRQALVALAGEPRFLSIAPDMGLASLTAADDLTSPGIKALARTYMQQQNSADSVSMNLDRIAFLTVTSTWFQSSSFAENGIIREDEQDGIITDYPESIGIWSRKVFHKASNEDQSLRYPEGCGSNPAGGSVKKVDTAMEYRHCIDAAIREQEQLSATNIQDDETMTGRHFGQFVCQKPARYGTDKNTARFNQIMTACELEELMIRAGIVQDSTPEGKTRPKFPLPGCSMKLERSSSVNWNLSLDIFTIVAIILIYSLGLFAGTVISSRRTESTGKEKSKTQ